MIKKCIEARQKINGGGEGTPGIEPDTVLKQGIQLHQRPQTVTEQCIYLCRV
jgi:hypothetical protein